MLFSARLSLGDLANLCRMLRHNLSAGLSLLDVFKQQSQRGPAAVRPVAGRVTDSLRTGDSLTAALEKEKRSFPPLFLSLAHVGEETGHLPEVFKELEQYFFLEQKLRRQFISQSFLPALQFFFAIFLIAGLIWVLGIIGAGRPESKPIAIFGLTGGAGALKFLAGAFGTLTLLIICYLFFKHQLRNRATVEVMLLRVPVLGRCLEAIAMSRLCLALQLTLDSGMTIMQALRLSLSATGNNAFAVHAEEVVAALKKKKPLTDALSLVKPLPAEFIDIVASSEEGGNVPEMMRHQAAYFQEESARRLTAVTRLASGLLWLIYAGFMIYVIFSIAQVYLSAIG